MADNILIKNGIKLMNIKETIENYIIKNTNELMSKYKIKEIGIAVPGTIKDGIILMQMVYGIRDEGSCYIYEEKNNSFINDCNSELM